MNYIYSSVCSLVNLAVGIAVDSFTTMLSYMIAPQNDNVLQNLTIQDLVTKHLTIQTKSPKASHVSPNLTDHTNTIIQNYNVKNVQFDDDPEYIINSYSPHLSYDTNTVDITSNHRTCQMKIKQTYYNDQSFIDNSYDNHVWDHVMGHVDDYTNDYKTLMIINDDINNLTPNLVVKINNVPYIYSGGPNNLSNTNLATHLEHLFNTVPMGHIKRIVFRGINFAKSRYSFPMVPIFNIQFYDIIKKLTNVESFIFNNVVLSKSMTNYMTNYMLHLENLTELSMINCNLTDNHINKIIKNRPKLLSLDISNNNKLTDKCLDTIGVMCKNILHLNLSNCHNITDKSIIDIIDKFKYIQILNVENCCKLSDRSLCRLTECTHLQELYCQGCKNISYHTINHLLNLNSNLRVPN